MGLLGTQMLGDVRVDDGERAQEEREKHEDSHASVALSDECLGAEV